MFLSVAAFGSAIWGRRIEGRPELHENRSGRTPLRGSGSSGSSSSIGGLLLTHYTRSRLKAHVHNVA